MTNNFITRFRHHLFIILFISTCINCSPHIVSKKGQENVPHPAKKIMAITTEEDTGSFYVKVKGNQILTYTSVKQPSPPGVILYFPATVVDFPQTELETESGVIGTIRISNRNRHPFRLSSQVQLEFFRLPDIHSGQGSGSILPYGFIHVFLDICG